MKLSLLLLLPVIVLAQLTPNSVTVTASRNSLVPSDLIVFNVNLTAAPDVSFDDVLAAASGAGLTAANFRGVNLQNGTAERATWQFAMTAPLNDTKAAVALLSALQQNLAKEKKFTLSFQIGGTDVSAQALQSQKCSLADLMTDARTRAANLASASGATAGAIQMLFASSDGCSLTVRFALGGIGQGAPGSIAITAQSAPGNAAPARVAIFLTVSADVTVALDNIVQTVSALGVSAADLYSVNQPFTGRICAVGNITAPCNPVQWNFQYTAPLSTWKDTLAKLAQARDAKHPGITIGYSVSADTPPPADCATPTLVSQARKRAQDVAAAAGLGLGALNAVSDGSAATGIPTLAVRTGEFSGSLGILTAYIPPPSAGCSVTAQFTIAP
jgi:membrane-bound inhibitor of C-type lysozyme